MLEYGVAIFMFAFGLLFIWQGVRRLQGKRGQRPDVLTRMAMPSMSEEGQQKALKAHDASNKVQGVLRIAFGLFVIALGIYLAI